MGRDMDPRDKAFKPERCKARAAHSVGRWGWTEFRQCSRKRVRDGYCAQHHPEAVAERRATADKVRAETWRRRKRIATVCALEDASTEELRAELRRRRAAELENRRAKGRK